MKSLREADAHYKESEGISSRETVMEGDEALIDAVRVFPCLYNSKIAEFRVVTKK